MSQRARRIATGLALAALAVLVFIAKRKRLLGSGVALAAVSVYVGSATIPGAGECEAPTCFPDATNTGIPDGRTLTTVSGTITLNTPGATYQDKIVNGCIEVTASNVTIRYVRVNANCASAIYTGDGNTGTIIEDSEVDCNGIDDDVAGRTAITWRNYTATRVDVYGGCDNGLWMDEDVVVEDSYIHEIVPCDIGIYDCGHSGEDPPHTDGMQGGGGADNITVRHNTVYGHYQEQDDPGTPGTDEGRFGNAAVNIAGGTPGATNLTYEDNLLAGGGFTMYCSGVPSATNVYTGNRFSEIFTVEDPVATNDVGGFGPTYPSCDDEPNFDATNVFHDGPNEGDPVIP
jgi:hypothetical protein